jgi:hypothetical protein
MGLYNVGFAGRAGGEFAERQMEQILKQRMFEEEQARMRAAQEQQAAAEQQRQAFDRETFNEGTRRYEQGRTDDMAAAGAAQAEKDAQERRFVETLSTIPNPALQRMAEAEHSGIKSGDIHDYEVPDVHTAHVTADKEAGFADWAGREVFKENLFRGRPVKADSGPQKLTPYQVLTQSRQLQKDWRAVNAPLRTLRQAEALMNAGMQAAEKGDLNAGSQAVLVTFQKILDPNSVVRETEYFRTASGQSLLTRIQGAAERLQKGGAGIPASDLGQFARLGKEAIARYAAEIEPDRQMIRALAIDSGLNPDLIARDDAPEPEAAPTPAGPKVGDEKTFPNGRKGRWNGRVWKPI